MRGTKGILVFVGALSYGSVALLHAAGGGTSLDDAAKLVSQRKFAEAIASVRASLASGKEHPSRVLRDLAFRPLMENPTHRAEVRKLLSQNVRESRLTMVFPNEPGPKLRVEGRVVRQQDGAAKSGVVVYFYQTDAKGIYAKIDGRDVGSMNPRLFAYVKTDESGRFTLDTIVPGSYPDSEELRHIHWEIHEAGRQGAFLFDDDPFLTPELRIKEAKYLQSVRTVEGVKVISPVIRL